MTKLDRVEYFVDLQGKTVPQVVQEYPNIEADSGGYVAVIGDNPVAFMFGSINGKPVAFFSGEHFPTSKPIMLETDLKEITQ